MRNNAAEPTLGHVIMTGAMAAGWLVLFLINLAAFSPTTKWYLLAVFSGVAMLGSAGFSVLLWVRMNRRKTGS
ncbi:hypothetical protein BKA01_006922 [Pseudonocardia eucalypti]|uniref:hypothetical protein n=1 Tax=Pseudonocardia eucalypti TaxID=648755 RepID=UPI001610EB62|nr:hypothetical protein [Pseudonocardia eucalypti]